MSTGVILIGRFLLGLYFLLPGLMKFADPDRHLALMATHGMENAGPLLWIAGIANVVGGVLLMSGRYVRLTALGCVAYILLVNFLLHNFWNFEGLKAGHELQNFIKNLGILAGLLVLAGYAPNRWPGLRGWWRSDRTWSSR